MREHGVSRKRPRSGLAQPAEEGSSEPRRLTGFEHYALLYSNADEYLAGTSDFLLEGDAAGEPLMVAIPGAKIAPLREALNGAADRVRFVKMNELGRNPGRIIPEVRDWVSRQDGRRCRFIGEPIWAERTEQEAIEATRHEALINLAFAESAAAILCPYDTCRLSATVLSDATRTHPNLICGATHWASDRYADPVELWGAPDWSLPEPEYILATLVLDGDLGPARELTKHCARKAGLSDIAVCDLVLALHEATSNTALHGQPPAELRIWLDQSEIVCEVADHGQLADPLAGRRRPEPDWQSGRGLWLINQLCDLVELRPTRTGTKIRLHMDLRR
jgi:anti-sigma regulatory factor (Ser/Thr protein kinase)